MSALEFRVDPIGWLNKNVLMVEDVRDMEVDTRPVRMFYFTKLDGFTVTNKPGGCVYNLSYRLKAEDMDIESGDDLIAAYWCPYQNGECRGVTIGNVAPFMFTATMNGCSFGVGSQTQDGSRLVYHVNKILHGVDLTNQQDTDDGFVRMAKSQKKKLRKRGIARTNIIDPRVYGGGTQQENRPFIGPVYAMVNTLTTVGWRETNTWKFYTHLYSKTGAKTYTNNGCNQCATIV